jgi:hypothetical protein
MGLMSYAHGTTYNGGNAPTVTLTGGGGSLSTVRLAEFIPYQMADNTWRMKFNIEVTVSTVTRTSLTLSINGLTFFSTLGDGQAFAGWANNGGLGVGYAVANTNTNTLSLGHASGSTAIYTMSGDVKLASKPTWAY